MNSKIQLRVFEEHGRFVSRDLILYKIFICEVNIWCHFQVQSKNKSQVQSHDQSQDKSQDKSQDQSQDRSQDQSQDQRQDKNSRLISQDRSQDQR